MFSKLPWLITAILVLAFLAAATPNATPTPPIPPVPTSSQCCKSIVSSTSAAAAAVAALVGLDLTGLNVPVGLSCSPITVAGNNCANTAVTCDAPEEEWGGLIAINCIPITA
ncbi:fungal hydrophobin [Mycena sanguinolenta]|nr:fungal hydrophobin [Mycena sanguinolenta]